MRTVVALLLLAIAANAYQVKTGGLKGAWFTNFIVTGPVDDMAAPTVSNFMIESTAADYMTNITGYGYGSDSIDFDFDVTDAVDDYPTCTTMFQLWDSTGTTVLNDLIVDDYFLDASVYAGSWPGTYASMLYCMDMTGNSNWWDSSTGTFDIMVANHDVDMDGYDVSNLQVNGGAAASVVIDSTFDTMDLDFTVDIANVASPGLYDMGVYYVRDAWVMGTWVSTSTGAINTDWMLGLYCTYTDATTGSCTGTWTVSNTDDIGVLTVSGVSVRDLQGNVSPLTSALVVTITNTAPIDVVSCQTLTLDILEDPTTPVDISVTYDYLDLDAGCTIKTTVSTVTNSIYVGYAHTQVMEVDGVVTTGNTMAYGDDTFFSDGTASPDVYFNFGLPGGLWRLDTVTTVTGYGASQYYTFALGSASSVAPSMVALAVAAAVAFLRL
jgi:hypothetical protein